jgi:hypothetical protein
MNWQRAPTHREAFFADVDGLRLFVQRTRRSFTAMPEFEGSIGGVRVQPAEGVDFGSIEQAMAAIEAAAKKKPALSSQEGQISAG